MINLTKEIKEIVRKIARNNNISLKKAWDIYCASLTK